MDRGIRPRDRSRESGSGTVDGAGVVSTFEGEISEGLLSVDEDSIEDDSLDLTAGGETGEMRGEIRADGTWQTTAVTWPDIEPDVDVPPMFGFDIDVSTVGPIEGEFDPAGRMTGSLALRIDIHVSAVVKSVDVTVAVDTGLTTETSGEMVGDADGLGTGSASVRLVCNEFTVGGTDEEMIDEMLGLPATDPGRNWLELALELDIERPVERA